VSTSIFLVLLAATIAALAARSFLRRWEASVLETANRELQIPVPRIQTMNRRQLIKRLLDDERLQRRIGEQAGETGMSVKKLKRRCRKYASEIVPAFKAVFYFRIGYWLARKLLTSLHRVHYRVADMEAIDEIEADASVVIIMNHRSNLDVLLINYLASRRATLMQFAGEWARMWPLYKITHQAGNPVVDRDAQDPLYKLVFRSFVRMAVREGANIAIFPEGELTRDGTMQAPRFGLLNFAVTASPARADKLYVIPVGLNYERIVEERHLVTEPDATYRHKGIVEVFASVVMATVILTARTLLPVEAQLGNACASVGRPIRLSDWLASRGMASSDEGDPREWVTALGNESMRQVASLNPVMPAHAMASLLLADTARTWSIPDLCERSTELLDSLDDRGKIVVFPVSDKRRSMEDTVDNFIRRKLITKGEQQRVSVNEKLSPVLLYLANSIGEQPEPV